jgi:hypothetical protein
MSQPLAVAIREALLRYLEGEQSLAEFQAWLAPVAWDIEKSDDASAVELVYEINLSLAERTNGHVSEGELRERLRQMMRTYQTVPSVVTGSSSRSVTPRVVLQRHALAGTQFVEVRG